jgi:hypothetical protein
MRRSWIAILAPLLLASSVVAGPIYAPGTLDYYFSLDWQVTSSPRGPVVEGFVYNKSGYGTDRMRLKIDYLDAAGNAVGSTTTWVLGGVPPSNRTWFEVRVAPAASYRVEILSFDWTGRGGASGGM